MNALLKCFIFRSTAIATEKEACLKVATLNKEPAVVWKATKGTNAIDVAKAITIFPIVGLAIVTKRALKVRLAATRIALAI